MQVCLVRVGVMRRASHPLDRPQRAPLVSDCICTFKLGVHDAYAAVYRTQFRACPNLANVTMNCTPEVQYTHSQVLLRYSQGTAWPRLRYALPGHALNCLRYMPVASSSSLCLKLARNASQDVYVLAVSSAPRGARLQRAVCHPRPAPGATPQHMHVVSLSTECVCLLLRCPVCILPGRHLSSNVLRVL